MQGLVAVVVALLAWDGDHGNDGDDECTFPVGLFPWGSHVNSLSTLGNPCPATEAPSTPFTHRVIICIGATVLPRLLAGSHWTKPLSQQDQGL